jgi:hypothetical protein
VVEQSCMKEEVDRASCADDEISTSNRTVPTVVSMSQHFVNLKMTSR